MGCVSATWGIQFSRGRRCQQESLGQDAIVQTHHVAQQAYPASLRTLVFVAEWKWGITGLLALQSHL